jgi:hypothetical protein
MDKPLGADLLLNELLALAERVGRDVAHRRQDRAA